MLLLIISEYYCPTTFLPLADTLPECSCSICLCSKGWLNTCEAMPVCFCSSPNNQRLSLCSSRNLNNPLPTHEPTICSGLVGAVTVPVWEQLHRVQPHKHVKSCFVSSLEGGTVGRMWRYCLSKFWKNTFSVVITTQKLSVSKMLFFFPYTHASKHTPDLSLDNAVYC